MANINALILLKLSKNISADLNNNLPIRKNTNRNLFGEANIEDTNLLIENEYQINKEQFINRYGIDIENLPPSLLQCNAEQTFL